MVASGLKTDDSAGGGGDGANNLVGVGVVEILLMSEGG